MDIIKTKKLAICIPTYQRSEIIGNVLDTEWKLLGDEIDLYVFDSSEDSLTKEKVREYQGNNSNIFYCRFSPYVSSNMKVFIIYKQDRKSVV